MKKDKQPIDSAWFKEQMSRRGLTQKEVAMKMGINFTLISHMYSGIRKMSLEEAMTMAEILRIPAETVIKKAGLTLHPKLVVNTRPQGKGVLRDQKVELSGFIDAGLTVHLGPVKGAPPVPNPTGQLGVEALRCQTLGGKFPGINGAILYYQPPLDVIARDILTRMCVVKVSGTGNVGSNGHYLLRIVNRGYEEGEYNLSTMNGDPAEEGVTLESAVPVVWMKL